MFIIYYRRSYRLFTSALSVFIHYLVGGILPPCIWFLYGFFKLDSNISIKLAIDK